MGVTRLFPRPSYSPLKIVAGSPKALSLLGRNGCLDYQGPFAYTQCELL